jgi:hypothetical protein
VLVFSFSPLAFLLQTAYAESMGLFLTLAVLCLLDRHRYLAAVPVTVLLAFTRPGVQAIALTVLLHLALRLRSLRKQQKRVPASELAAGVLLLVVATVSGFAWSWIAGIATGRPDAYLRTELAWRASWMGTGGFAPMVPWAWAADFWFGPAGPVVLAAAAAGFAALLLSRPVRGIGATSRVWLVSWALYLVGVFFPQSSTFRLLMPMAPAAGAFAGIRDRRVLAAVLVCSVALQAFWLYRTFGGWQHFWSIP